MKKLNRKNKQRRHNEKTNWKEDPSPDYPEPRVLPQYKGP